MLTVSRISKRYADQEILHDITFSLNPGERVGLVGPNGCGKTTLLKIILGQEGADGGSVAVSPEVRVGYLAQGLTAAPEATIQDLLDEALGGLASAEADVERLAAALAEAPGAAEIERAYEAALARLQQVSERAETGAVLATLKNLGLAEIPLGWPVAQLSGGQKTRLALALVLLARPQLLLLDEPTNHLDLDRLIWLEA
jgi:ATPase subunit of ABC transporter with duplicated ATPase domains